jgi:polyphosphate kinase
MDSPDLKRSDLYINRELSLLAFNRRVLDQARDPQVPALERLRFMCISSSNLDEFFEIRVAGLKQRTGLEATQPIGPEGITPQELLRAISTEAHALVSEQYQVLNGTIIPLLADSGIDLIRRGEWKDAQEKWLKHYFRDEVLPVLTPIGLDPAHPFPRIINKSLNFIVSLEGKDAFGRSNALAVVQAPRSLPRVIALPKAKEGRSEFVFLSSVIHAYVDELFPGMKAKGCFQFRLTRNSDLFVDEDEADDLLHALQGELHERRYGDAVRLEVARETPEEIVGYLLSHFQLERDDCYPVDGPVNLPRLLELIDKVERPELKWGAFSPSLPRALRGADIFDAIGQQDVLLHHPYESFAPVVDFIRQAATDPNVLAIKQTLYRTGPDSVIVDALAAAARSGKEVVVVIELRARFDEEANIALATKLQQAGAHVLYGVVGHKTHAKAVLVVRREGRKLRRYVHLGTGNYHPRTVRLYTDYGLLTADPEIGEDVHALFMHLTSLGKVSKMNRLLLSPFALKAGLEARIDREIEHARKGRKARIIMKMNALVDPEMIQALYRAAQAGVKVDLIVRGMCSLRPGLAGLSENVRVRSVVGRFLEHSRVFYFRNDDDPEVLCASADLMERNLYRRVEVCFPILDKKHRERVIADLKAYLRDDLQSWNLDSSGGWTRAAPAKDAAGYSIQADLLAQLAEGG